MIKAIYNRIIYLGISNNYEFLLKKEIRIINNVNLFAAIDSIIFSTILIVFNNPTLAILDFNITLGAFIGLFLNYLKRHNFATIFTFMYLPITLVIISYVYGRVASEYYIIPLIIILAYINKFTLKNIWIPIFYLIIFSFSKYLEISIKPTEPASIFAPYFYYINILGSFLVITIFIRLFIVEHEKNRRELKSLNTRLSSRNQELVTKNKKIETLIKEINHRTKNNLQLISSLINLQSKDIEQPEIKDILHDIRNRIFTIGLVHKKLYLNKCQNTICLIEYINELIMSITNSLASPSDEISIELLSIKKIHVEIDDAVHIGIIINELVTNSIKHGLSNSPLKKISIKITENENSFINIEVYDSGSGIENLNNMVQYNFGLNLVKIIIEQYNGSINFKENGGNHVILSLKLQYYEENTNP